MKTLPLSLATMCLVSCYDHSLPNDVDVSVTGTVLFSSLDGGGMDADGTVDGIFTSTNDMSIADGGRIQVDVPSAILRAGSNFTMGEGASVVASSTQPGFGALIAVEAQGQVEIRGATTIIASGVSDGGLIQICADGDMTVLDGARFEAFGSNQAGSKGGNVIFSSGGILRFLGGNSAIAASGGIGGSIALSSCSDASQAMEIHGRLDAVGTEGNGGEIMIQARRGGLLISANAILEATGAVEDGAIQIEVAQSATIASTNLFPTPTVSEGTVNESACGCLDSIEIQIVPLTSLSGLAPLSVGWRADVVSNYPIVEYRWDYQGDGIVDEILSSSGEANFSYTDEGMYMPTVTAVDVFGGAGSASIAVQVDSFLIADLVGHPLQGQAPHAVAFFPGGQASVSSIDIYRMDFDYDGLTPQFDVSQLVPQTITHTYTQSGTYTALLEVEDLEGNTATDTVQVVVGLPPPVGQVTLAPSNGPAPLNVLISVAASSPNGSITRILIDPGDGADVTELSGPGSHSHTYTNPGDFQLAVTIEDSAGASALLDSPVIQIDVGPPGAPTAVASASPEVGVAPLNVTFSPAGSVDSDGSIVLYEWDFNYDGSNFQAEEVTTMPDSVMRSYTGAGAHIAALRVTDNGGLSSIDAVSVRVSLDVTVSVAVDTINPQQGETVDVQINQTAGVFSTTYIRSRAGQRVRTLDSGFHAQGTHVYPWDGKSSTGAILPDGDYYAECEYMLDGILHREPNTPSGGNFAFVSQGQNASNGAPIDPWNDEFWELTMNTNLGGIGASEVTLWITPFANGTDITQTMFSSAVFGTGTYMAFWDGITSDGDYISDVDNNGASSGDYLWAAKAWALPENVIVIEGDRPLITNPTAEPNILDPTITFCGQRPGVEVAFELDRLSSVALSIVNMDTKELLRVVTEADLDVGAHTIHWDGKTSDGKWAAEGPYRIDIRATSPSNTPSHVRRVLAYLTY